MTDLTMVAVCKIGPVITEVLAIFPTVSEAAEWRLKHSPGAEIKAVDIHVLEVRSI